MGYFNKLGQVLGRKQCKTWSELYMHGSPHTTPAERSLLLCVTAALYGVLALIVGGFGLGSFFSAGPLGTILYTRETLLGGHITASSVGAIVSAVCLLLSFFYPYVGAGLGRVYAWRRVRKGYPLSVAEWETIASSASIWQILETPWMAHGLLLIYACITGITSIAYAGILIPGEKHVFNLYHTNQSTSLAEYALTNGKANCLTSLQESACPMLVGFGDIANAWARHGYGIAVTGYEVSGVVVTSNVGYVGGPSLNTQMGALERDIIGKIGGRGIVRKRDNNSPVRADGVLYTTFSTYGNEYTLSCGNNTGVYVTADSRYGYMTHCGDEGAVDASYTVNNTVLSAGTYTAQWQNICPLNDTAITFEYAVAGLQLDGDAWGVVCNITGTEGVAIINTTDKATRMLSYKPLMPLTSNALMTIASAVVRSLLQDGGMMGHVGIMGLQMASNYRYSGNGPLIGAEEIIGQALTAATTILYDNIGNASPSPSEPFFDAEWKVGMGWTDSWQRAAWSITALAVGILWLLCACYCTYPHIRYNPSEWSTTVNMGAGAAFRQVPGTCTGTSISKVTRSLPVWLGQASDTHMLLSQHALPPPFRQGKYGQLQPNCVKVSAGRSWFIVNKGKSLNLLLTAGKKVCDDASRPHVLANITQRESEYITVHNLNKQDAIWLVSALLGVCIVENTASSISEPPAELRRTDVIWHEVKEVDSIPAREELVAVVMPYWLQQRRAIFKGRRRFSQRVYAARSRLKWTNQPEVLML